MPFQHATIQPKNRVFVFNRIATCGEAGLRSMKLQGTKIVCDMDDSFVLDEWHYLHTSFRDNHVADRIIASLRLADVVMVTNTALADTLRPYCDVIEIVPNALPFDSGQFQRSIDTESESPLIYAGGASHFLDLTTIRNVIDDRELTLAGYDPKHVEWMKIKAMLPQAAAKHVLPLQQYMRAYDGHRCAIAPLVSSPFNACKSNLKILEAGAKGIPIIVSAVSPYNNRLDARFTCQAHNAEDWREFTQAMISDAQFARDAGAALAEHVRRHYDLKDANELRRQIIESL